MAHITKVNGTAYEILGGSTKVNGTDYDIIKGKTKVGGTNYDIDFTPPYTWIGWDNATWADVVELVEAKRDGLIHSFPSDIVVGISKPLKLEKNVRPQGYSSGIWSSGTWKAYLIGIGTNSLTFQWQTTYSMRWDDTYNKPYTYLQLLNNATGTTTIDSAMKKQSSFYAYYYTGSSKNRRFPAGRFFIPRIKMWKGYSSVSEQSSPSYTNNIYTIPVLASGYYWFGTLSGSTTSNYIFRVKTGTETTANASYADSNYYLFPCFEIIGT